jgi:hypothetical protein
MPISISIAPPIPPPRNPMVATKETRGVGNILHIASASRNCWGVT